MFIHLRSVLLFPVSRCQVLCLRCYGMFLGNFFYSSLSRRFISSVSRQVCFFCFFVVVFERMDLRPRVRHSAFLD